MVWSVVALINQGISTLNTFGRRIVIGHWRDIWIVLPQLRAQGADVRDELSGMPIVQIAKGRSQHYDIARGKSAMQY
jgi:hypothetical protein